MDRITTSITFRKAYWTCSCGKEDITDLNVGTPSVYEHNCSLCGKWSNSFKEYNGCLSFSPEEYEKKTKEDLDKVKQERCDEWIYSVKNPAPYIEPTKLDLEKEKADLEMRVAEVDARIRLKVEAQPIKEDI